MSKKWRIFVIVCLGLSLLTSCQYKKTFNDQENQGVRISNVVYLPLNSEDIQKFVDDNHIEVLGVNTLYGYKTVVIFGDLYSRGYYELYKKEGEVLEGRKVDTSGDWTDSESIVFSGGTASGDYPFSILYILDDALINKGHVIKIIGDKGNYEFNLTQKAIAFETKIIGNVVGYKVINSNGEIIVEGQ